MIEDFDKLEPPTPLEPTDIDEAYSVSGRGRGKKRRIEKLRKQKVSEAGDITSEEREAMREEMKASLDRAIAGGDDVTELDRLRLKEFRESEEYKKAAQESEDRMRATMEKIMTTQVEVEGHEKPISVVESIVQAQAGLAMQHQLQESIAHAKAEEARLIADPNRGDDPINQLIEEAIKAQEERLQHLESSDYTRATVDISKGNDPINILMREINQTIIEGEAREERNAITEHIQKQSE